MAENSPNSFFITIEFVLALPDEQPREQQKFQQGITLKEALPFFSLYHRALKETENPQWGIFNLKIEDNYLLKDGDRIEVYRPLIIDPKQARQIRASRDARFQRKGTRPKAES